MEQKRIKLSVVIPVYNSENTIAALVKELFSLYGTLNIQVVLVNDASEDRSEEICEDIANNNLMVTFVSLRKNFGEHNAVMCGLHHAKGEYCAILDDDFQNPPKEISKLLAEIEKGYDVVYARYNEKKHGVLRNLGSQFNDYCATFMIGKPKDLYLCSFKIIKKELIEEIIKYRGPFPYIDGLILRVTRNIGVVDVEHERRIAGKSNYNLSKLVRLYLNMFLNFSITPIRLCSFAGFCTIALGVVLGIITLIERAISSDIPSGWALLVMVILIFSGTQLLFLGIIGEFLGKQYLDQNGTPQWVIKKRIN